MGNPSRFRHAIIGCLLIVALIGTLLIGLTIIDFDGEPTNDEGNLSSNDSLTQGPEDSNSSNDNETELQLIPDSPSVPSSILPEYEPPDPDKGPGVGTGESLPFTGFTETAETIGLEYETGDGGAAFPHRHGSYVADVNNNGYEDVLLLGGDNPVLYENVQGGFEQSEEFDVFGSTDPTVAHFLDYNNNGYEDLVLFAPNHKPVLNENRAGNFTAVSGVFNTTVRDPRTVSSADFTNNGCLDVYVGSWFESTGHDFIDHLIEVGESHPEIRPEARGPENNLFMGTCGEFEEITDDAGVGGGGFTFATSAADFTDNGHIDIHVGNDFTTDYIYENQGDGTFESIDLGPNSDRNAMASAVMDLTGNHLLDIFVTNVYFEDPPEPAELVPVNRVALPDGNNLFANQGDGEFVDIAPEHGLNRGGWGWASTLADFTNDGHLDIIHATSYVNPDILPPQPEIFGPPQVWNGTGTSWMKVDGWDIGLELHNMRGLTRVDYNANGALDLVAVGNPSSRGVPGTERGKNRTFFYENSLESQDFLQLWVRNPGGIERNAGVYIETNERTIYRETNSRGDFSSQDSRLIHVGLANETIDRVVVEWPDGNTIAYDQLESGTRYMITPGGAESV